MSESDHKEVLFIEALVFNILTFIASVVFLYRFFKIPTKNYGLYMILVLNITDLAFLFVNFLSQIFMAEQAVSNFFGALGPPIFRFSLYWSAWIAYFIYLVMNSEKLFSPKGFFFKALIWCLILSLASVSMYFKRYLPLIKFVF